MSKAFLIENFSVKSTDMVTTYDNLPDGVVARVRYPICNVGKKNRNKRKYDLDVCEAILADKEVLERINERRCWGHSEHPDNGSKTEFLSHVITKLELSPDKKLMFCEADVLGTPYGKIVEVILRAKCGLGMSTRAEGETESCIFEDGEKGSKVLAKDFKFDTVDFTADPSTYGALPEKVVLNVVKTIKESVDRNELKPNEAKHLLEGIDAPTAKKLLERIQSNKGHTGCSVRLSERDCSKCKGANTVNDRFERMSRPELKSAWESFLKNPGAMSGSDCLMFQSALTRKGVLTESEAFVELAEARKVEGARTQSQKLTESRLGDTLEARARKEFPQADSVDSSVYVLTDGTGIAFDGDHRDINVVFRGGVPKGYYNQTGSGSGKMLAFMGETGAVRVRTSSDGTLNMSFIRTPTREQVRTILRTRAPMVYVDKLGKMYDTLKSDRFSMPDESYALESFLSSGGESRGEEMYESAKKAALQESAAKAKQVALVESRLRASEKARTILSEKVSSYTEALSKSQKECTDRELRETELRKTLEESKQAALKEVCDEAAAKILALEESLAVAQGTISQLTNSKAKALAESAENHKREMVKVYVERIVSSGLRLTESQRALLSDCTTTAQVDETVRAIRTAIRECAPHLATHLTERTTPPTQVEQAVSKVFAAF